MSRELEQLKEKLAVLELARKTRNVSKVCRQSGISRDTFYRWKSLYEKGGEEALKEASRTKPNLKNRLPVSVESAVLKLSLRFPRYGQQRIARLLLGEGVHVSPQGVRAIWLRNGLEKKQLRMIASERSTESSDPISPSGGVLSEQIEMRSEDTSVHITETQKNPLASEPRTRRCSDQEMEGTQEVFLRPASAGMGMLRLFLGLF